MCIVLTAVERIEERRRRGHVACEADSQMAWKFDLHPDTVSGTGDYLDTWKHSI